MRVRRILHKLGLRYRLHDPELPGTPDLVFPGARIVVFVHGCFWHRHPGCRRTTTPTARRLFWTRKFRRNEQRDRETSKELTRRGWRVRVIWECETLRAPELLHLAYEVLRGYSTNERKGARWAQTNR